LSERRSVAFAQPLGMFHREVHVPVMPVNQPARLNVNLARFPRDLQRDESFADAYAESLEIHNESNQHSSNK
jgi:hypothetical protein